MHLHSTLARTIKQSVPTHFQKTASVKRARDRPPTLPMSISRRKSNLRHRHRLRLQKSLINPNHPSCFHSLILAVPAHSDPPSPCVAIATDRPQLVNWTLANQRRSLLRKIKDSKMHPLYHSLWLHNSMTLATRIIHLMNPSRRMIHMAQARRVAVRVLVRR